jgi:lipid-A-disaccharide synthase
MIQAADLIHQNKQEVTFIISRATSIKKGSIETCLKTSGKEKIFQINDGPVKNIFLKSDLVIAASGTVTLEAALWCVPTIIIYKMSYLSYRAAKLFVKIKYAGLANLIVNRQVMPELLQNDATPFKISQKALYMLDHLNYFENQLQVVRKLLGKKGASARAAGIAVNLLRQSDLRY